jgi:hypothetical protein
MDFLWVFVHIRASVQFNVENHYVLKQFFVSSYSQAYSRACSCIAIDARGGNPEK